MSLSGNQGRLTGLAREFAVEWAETRTHWRDAKSEEFDQKYMVELAANISRSITVMEQLEELLKKVRSDCE